MSKPSRGFAVVTLLAAVVVCGTYAYNSVDAQDKEKPREKVAAEVAKWEYRVVVVHQDPAEGQKELNVLGEQGFEVAFVTCGQVTRELGQRGGGGDSQPIFHYTLRRAKK